VKWLIEKDADVNVAGMVNGFTPLFAACENNDLDVAKILVEAGADTNAKSRDGGRLSLSAPPPLSLSPSLPLSLLLAQTFAVEHGAPHSCVQSARGL
jgi:ankyrin repeat protein